MNPLDGTPNNRILVVDDNEAIDEDFDKLLKNSRRGAAAVQLDELAASLLGNETQAGLQTAFPLTHARGRVVSQNACVRCARPKRRSWTPRTRRVARRLRPAFCTTWAPQDDPNARG